MDLETKQYIALSAVMFLEYAIWGAWAPVLAARLLGPLKMNGKQTGWIYATLPIACIFAPMVAGWVADKYVDLKWILIAAHAIGAVLLFAAAKQQQFKPLLIVMFLYSVCYAASIPLVNAALFNATSDPGTRGNVFVWAPIAWALVGWILTGWRMTRKEQGDGSDCLKFAAGLSVAMVIACLWLSANEPTGTAGVPIVAALSKLGEMNFLFFVVLSMVIAGMMQFYFLGSAQFMQDKGISSKHVPASMALAQVVQALATVFLLGFFLKNLEFKWTLTIGAACWFLMYAAYIKGAPRGMLIAVQPLHGLAYVFFIIAGQICAEAFGTKELVSSMQALIITATTGVGMFAGTQLAGFVMDKYSVDGAFQWAKVWKVPCIITLVGVLAFAAVFQEPSKADTGDDPAKAKLEDVESSEPTDSQSATGKLTDEEPAESESTDAESSE